MPLSISELKRLRKRCSTLRNGADYRCDNYVENLIWTAIDFQLDAEKVVVPAMDHFKIKYGFAGAYALKRFIDRISKHQKR